MTQLSRRDFLKAAGVVLAGAALTPSRAFSVRDTRNNQRPNIIVVLCDALSAPHLSLYGYPRLTTPNIDSFAARSTVFHNHYSGSNFTSSGTASLLTGMLPWKHRAINYGGLIKSEFIGINPYTLLGSDYYRFAFSQNPWADQLIGQWNKDVDRFLPPSSYSLLESADPVRLFENDRVMASIALGGFLFQAEGEDGPVGSSEIGYLNKSRTLKFIGKQNLKRYPDGIPEVVLASNPYLNEEIYFGAFSELSRLDSENAPYFAYFHLFSPHFPYKPRSDFKKLFHDDYAPAAKPNHPMANGFSEDYLLSRQTAYDRQIAQVDDEFGRLIAKLDKDGILENSYLIFTSDHGELFERGFVGHGRQFMYEGALRVPLLIHAPSQTRREDIFAPTSNTDILPTLLSIAGKYIPADIDGKLLPAFGGSAEPNRAVLSILAMDNSAFAPLKKAVVAMRKGDYKLIAYLGYADMAQPFELYNLEGDPNEFDNLAAKEKNILSAMKGEFLSYLEEANKPFERK
ncbi:MAG: sulfatase [Anaerolineales bacterium]|nr:sulfatase [Anaerolineales bacterium]